MPLPQSINIVVQAVAAADTEQVVVRRRSDGSLEAVGYFNLKDAGGNFVRSASVSVALNGSQTTSINSFVTSVLVPAMNAQ